MFTTLKALAIPEGDVIKIEANGMVLWELAVSEPYKNWAKVATEADGVTVFNGGKGYKDGYRIRSGGAEGEASAASCTGYISVAGKKTVGLGGYDVAASSNANAINVYNASHTHLGQIVSNYAAAGYGIFAAGASHVGYCWNSGTKKDDCFYWTIPQDADIAYIRVTGYTFGDGSKMIVTLDEEIT